METICVQRREGAIKAKKLRRLGFIPANVFGKSLPDPISIQLKESDARRLLHQKREGSKLMLDLEGTGLPVQIKEKEIDTIKGQIQHISFQALTADEKVNSVIHILLVNDDKIPGQLDKMLMEIPYASLPGDMIDTITVDLDGITVGTCLLYTSGQHRLDGSKQYRLVGSGRQKGVYMTDVYVISGFLGAGKTCLLYTS